MLTTAYLYKHILLCYILVVRLKCNHDVHKQEHVYMSVKTLVAGVSLSQPLFFMSSGVLTDLVRNFQLFNLLLTTR